MSLVYSTLVEPYLSMLWVSTKNEKGHPYFEKEGALIGHGKTDMFHKLYVRSSAWYIQPMPCLLNTIAKTWTCSSTSSTTWRQDIIRKEQLTTETSTIELWASVAILSISPAVCVSLFSYAPWILRLFHQATEDQLVVVWEKVDASCTTSNQGRHKWSWRTPSDTGTKHTESPLICIMLDKPSVIFSAEMYSAGRTENCLFSSFIIPGLVKQLKKR